MTRPQFGPYHLGEQHAGGLLSPIEASLGQLCARLNQYVQRIPMSEADRARVAVVEGIVREAYERVARTIAAG